MLKNQVPFSPDLSEERHLIILPILTIPKELTFSLFYGIKTNQIMKNKRLIRIIAIIFVLVTGMNSYSDLVLCRHDNGDTSIVTSEFHCSFHSGKVSNEEQSCYIHEVEDCHTCIDIPIQIKNITILISRISLKEKLNSIAYFNSDIIRVSLISVSGRFSDKFPDLPVFRAFAEVVLLI